MKKKRILVVAALVALFNLAFSQALVARFPNQIDCAQVACDDVAKNFPGLGWSESSSSSNKSGVYVQAADPAGAFLFEKEGNKPSVAMKAYSRADGRDQVWLATAYPINVSKTIEDFSTAWTPEDLHTMYQCNQKTGVLMCPVYVDTPSEP